MESAVNHLEITAPPRQATRRASSPWPEVAVLVLIAVVLFVIRVTAPPDVLDQDQERPASYVLDAVRNGNWICQRDWTGDVTSKPPMWTWLASIAASFSGRVNLFALYWPGAAGALGSALLIFFLGHRYFGARAALLGAVACLVTTAGAKQMGLARTDGVFAFTVTLTALLTFRAWQLGKGWIWVWLAAAAATLTKGPVGPLLAGFGLFAAIWEKRSRTPYHIRGQQWAGIGCFLLIVGGWFLLAYAQLGEALTEKMIGRELVGHAVQSNKGAFPGTALYKQPLYYLGRAAPWSLLATFGLWQIWRRPAPLHPERRLERFLFCWFVVGLFMFSLAPHQRADLLWPIMPAGALIAGRELDRLAHRYSARRFAMGLAVLVLLGISGFWYYYFIAQGRTAFVKQTVALKHMAGQIEQAGSSEFPLTYVDAPMTLQVYLNTIRPPIPAKRAAELLQGSEAAYVAVSNVEAVLEAMGSAAEKVTRILETPAFVRKKAVTLLSNQSGMGDVRTFAFCFGPVLVKAQDVKLLSATEKEFRFASRGDAPQVSFLNEGAQARRFRVIFDDGAPQTAELPTEKSWTAVPSKVTAAH